MWTLNENALLDALHSGHLVGAALDVPCDEDSNGMPHHSLVGYYRTHDNLIISPHLGGCTLESIEKTEVFLAEKLCYMLAGSWKFLVTSAEEKDRFLSCPSACGSHLSWSDELRVAWAARVELQVFNYAVVSRILTLKDGDSFRINGL
jgi:D-isomer specific 2-hydroxyacid dehydrogenase, NAD binding domain